MTRHLLLPALLLSACATVRGAGAEDRVNVEVRTSDPAVGPANAPVRIVFFGDFQ